MMITGPFIFKEVWAVDTEFHPANGKEELAAFDKLQWHDHACNLDDRDQTETSHHEVDNVPYLEVAAFGKGCQTVFQLRRSLFWLTNQPKLIRNF